MRFLAVRISLLIVVGAALVVGSSVTFSEPDQSQPVVLTITVQAEKVVTARYELQKAVPALHYERELGGYRAETWAAVDPTFRWVVEGEGERLERSDGQPFDVVEISMPIDYRSLPKSYAPFSPFSQDGFLLHSGQFHVCLTGPCEEPSALAVTIQAQGETIGVYGQRFTAETEFVSRDSGTNVFVGGLLPVDADGFVAIIDPGLPASVRTHLGRSLPQAMRYFEEVYGALSAKPELYVSIDSRPARRGRNSTQGGTLPNQIFMHLDGEGAQQRVSDEQPFWLDWFFAHEAAHLFQRNGAGLQAFDDKAAWIHEGGADAMAAVALAGRGDSEQTYVVGRLQEAHSACEEGLVETTLDRASAEGRFDLHYQCGLLIWLALDEILHSAGEDGLHSLNKLFFERVRADQVWSTEVFLRTAGELGVGSARLGTIRELSNGEYDNPSMRLKAVARLAELSLERQLLTED